MRKIKLRYYLRGLGIGILVTVLVMSMANKDKAPMTDAQIRARALELGMVDAGSIVLSELREESDDELTATSGSESEEEETPLLETGKTEEDEEIVGLESESTEVIFDDVTEEIPESIEESGLVSNGDSEVITIKIQSGTHSYTVSKELEAAGLIEDAEEFDSYLCNNGYSRSVRVGTYKIAVGTSEEEIAEIITKNR